MAQQIKLSVRGREREREKSKSVQNVACFTRSLSRDAFCWHALTHAQTFGSVWAKKLRYTFSARVGCNAAQIFFSFFFLFLSDQLMNFHFCFTKMSLFCQIVRIQVFGIRLQKGHLGVLWSSCACVHMIQPGFLAGFVFIFYTFKQMFINQNKIK